MDKVDFARVLFVCVLTVKMLKRSYGICRDHSDGFEFVSVHKTSDKCV